MGRAGLCILLRLVAPPMGHAIGKYGGTKMGGLVGPIIKTIFFILTPLSNLKFLCKITHLFDLYNKIFIINGVIL